MRNLMKTAVLIMITVLTITSCSKQEKVANNEISQEVKDQIYALGFGTSNIQKIGEGYLVEGDIILTPEILNSNPNRQFLRIGDEEQYRTTNLVTGLPRTIKVSVDSKLPSSYIAATDVALGRYNALNLGITFQRASSGANISIVNAHGSYLGSSGFPSSSGNPYGKVNLNSRAIGNQPQGTIASIIAHEIGHCIGMRHTDYFNRALSCGGSAVNEGDGGVGAIYIPGTATGFDKGSWMLSCIGAGEDRPFTSNDRTALNYLY